MGNVSKNTATKPPTDRQRMRDNNVLRLLAGHGGRSAMSLADQLGVTRGAIYLSLHRLTLAKAVTREPDEMRLARGRPGYLYCITSQGEAALAKAADEENAQQELKPWLVNW